MTQKTDDPLALFAKLYAEVAASGAEEPTAMLLSTADATGRPSSRVVLLKQFDDRGFVFYTNLESQKGRQIAANPWASLCFYWPQSDRQVRVEGSCEPVSDEEADAYFASRDRGSQLGAWASRQSRPLQSRAHLLKEVARFEIKYLGGPVPRPPHWSGVRVRPERIEFWQRGTFRLHDRFVYEPHDGGWRKTRLSP